MGAITDMAATYGDDLECEPGVARLYFEYNVGAANAITIVRATGFAAGTAAIVRTGVGIHDFVLIAPPFQVLSWSIKYILATPASVAVGGSAEPSVADNSTPALGSKLTVTHRRADTRAATDLANGDVVIGYIVVKTVGAGT